jgi:hypothetical protein
VSVFIAKAASLPPLSAHDKAVIAKPKLASAKTSLFLGVSRFLAFDGRSMLPPLSAPLCLAVGISPLMVASKPASGKLPET